MSGLEKTDYEIIGIIYRARYEEPLVAGPEWVEPLHDTVRAAVECDPNLDTSTDGWLTRLTYLAASRTADVIHVITYGLDTEKMQLELSPEEQTYFGLGDIPD